MSFDFKNPVMSTELDFPRRQGKVRDVYDLGDRLLIVSSDRISAFDWVLPVGIPGKGIILNQLSKFWFGYLRVDHHMLTTELPADLCLTSQQQAQLAGRSMITRKADVIPFECVVRGYLEGSGWREYQQTGTVCGIQLPKGLQQCERLPEPIFTPATKAESGHDENISYEMMANKLGADLATQLREQSISVYNQGREWAQQQGIIIADTKFEWGWYDGKIILIDEVLTPDSSRFWPSQSFQPGHSQPSFDKQYVREWLMGSSWDRNSPPPTLPAEVVELTRSKYQSAYELLVGKRLPES